MYEISWKRDDMAGRPGRPKRTEEVTSLLLRLPPALLSKLDRCKAVLEWREGRRLTRTSVLGRALDVGVAYLLAADNGSGPLPFRLRCVNQPVISTPNVFSSTRSPLLGCIRAHFSCSTPRSSTSARF